MITLRRLRLRRGARMVLEEASLAINPGQKLGLVGSNGAGKSSLLAALAGRLEPDGGEVDVPKGWRIAEVAQDMPQSDTPVTEYVLQGDGPLIAARQDLLLAESRGDGHAIAQAHVSLAQAGAFDARSRAQALLMGLGFEAQQLDAAVNSLSGGWRMRLQLARALMSPADLLLLDEPTNHLDLDALVWLESWLARVQATVLIISHDREFLDAVTQVTIHLEGGRLTRYGGNYSAFEAMRAERIRQQTAALSRQSERIAHLQRFIDRFKAKASKAKQAQSRVKALARMERLAPILTAGELSFELKPADAISNPMLSLQALDCGYGERTVVGQVQASLLAGQRIGILGANGQGKSTLIKTICGQIEPLAGRVIGARGLRIGYFAQQEMDLLQDEQTALQSLTRWAREKGPPAREQELRDFLGKFRFAGELAQQPVGTLSGGERARLVLAMIVWQGPNLLVLDEPTNHLDLQTREALSLALNGFEGTVLLVSHDRALLREVCDEFWLVSGARLQPFDGDLEDYQRWLAQAQGAGGDRLVPPDPSAVPPATSLGAIAAPVNRRDQRRAAATQRQQQAVSTRPLRQEQQQAEARLAEIAEERQGLEAHMARNSGTASGPEIARAARALHALQQETEALELRWLEIAEALQSLESGPSSG